MIAATARAWALANACAGRSWRAGKIAEAVAAMCAAGLLVVSAALPGDRDAAAALSTREGAGLTDIAGRETAFGAYLGAPYHYPSDFHLQKAGVHDLTIKDIAWYTRPFDNPLYYGARIQRWMSGGQFGTMIDFTHSKAYAPIEKPCVKTEKPCAPIDDAYAFEGTLGGKPVPTRAKISGYFDKLEWTHGHNMLTLNGLMRFASFGNFQPYAGAGAGISLPHSEIHLLTDPARTYEYQYTGPCAQALIGLELRLKTGSIFFEYKFTVADYSGPLTGRDGTWFPVDMWRQFSRWLSGEEPPGGWAGARLTSHQAIGGFMVRFKPAGPSP